MYRMLIVDDEPIIVEGLLFLFQGLSLNLDIYSAYTAQEAINITRKTKFDIVISDIQMPGKSGLQMVDEILYYWPSCKIIFLTGHDEFDFVYTAIKKNVEGYILKTEDDEMLIQTVQKTIEKIDDEKRKQDLLIQTNKQMTHMKPLLKNEYCRALLQGENIGHSFLDGTFNEVSLQLDLESSVLLLVGIVDDWSKEVTYHKKMNTFYALQNYLKEHLIPSLIIEEFVSNHVLPVWYIQSHPETEKFRSGTEVDWDGIIKYLKSALESVQNTFLQGMNMSISFAISRKDLAWHDIPREYDTMRTLLKKGISPQQQMAMIDLNIGNHFWVNHPKEKYTDVFTFKRQLKQLEGALDRGDVKHSQSISEQLMNDLQRDIEVNRLVVIENHYSLLHFLLSYTNTQQMMGEVRDLINMKHLSIMNISTNWDDFRKYVKELIGLICAEREEQMAHGSLQMIDIVHHYIQENLGGDLSLSRISEVVYLNPSYFSRFYKQHTGRNLSEYINDAKSAAAMQMLEDPHVKVNQIATHLGFTSPSYFTLFFKKSVGKSPQKYRESIMNLKRK